MTEKEEKTKNEDIKLTNDRAFPETDVILVVEDQKIHVNKAVLSQHSPVFDTMFNSHFTERTAKEIPLVEKKADDVVEFLRCFYPNMKHPLTAENVLKVLPLAHEYQTSLVTDCEDFMIKLCAPNKRLTVNILLDYILAGEKYGLTRFLEAAVEFCANIDFDLLNGKSFDYYSDSSDEEKEDKDISSKFSMIGLKTQYSISKKRLQRMEMCKRKSCKVKDYTIALS